MNSGRNQSEFDRQLGALESNADIIPAPMRLDKLRFERQCGKAARRFPKRAGAEKPYHLVNRESPILF
ncbi:MAG TPA: hypothetical protein VJQ55_03740, partial [Candidatus Binatia bacterium]|nr:hypothetical protein [Candidatus Binatia bacterium]